MLVNHGLRIEFSTHRVNQNMRNLLGFQSAPFRYHHRLHSSTPPRPSPPPPCPDFCFPPPLDSSPTFSLIGSHIPPFAAKRIAGQNISANQRLFSSLQRSATNRAFRNDHQGSYQQGFPQRPPKPPPPGDPPIELSGTTTKTTTTRGPTSRAFRNDHQSRYHQQSHPNSHQLSNSLRNTTVPPSTQFLAPPCEPMIKHALISNSPKSGSLFCVCQSE